jgi:hypothetical protein
VNRIQNSSKASSEPSGSKRRAVCDSACPSGSGLNRQLIQPVSMVASGLTGPQCHTCEDVPICRCVPVGDHLALSRVKTCKGLKKRASGYSSYLTSASGET